ncbi:Predicted membrane protein [Nocardioides scoriae]|uniref:Predicted membrane protein n=1 Tax=Nocardioides scoriae TaxID=642780 RepID=A0A1H1RKT8_9ACTN|nr:DUF2207 domain-containing protein [Nocardioides scoriae]SDS36282.1 Predicted membrane protein [Nocardioides scoriae]
MRSVLRGAAALLLVGLVLLPLLRTGDPVPEALRGATVTDYRAAYELDGRGTLSAAETLRVSLGAPRAGLVRVFDLADPGDGRVRRLPSEVTVTRDGQVEEVALERTGSTLVVRAGDHDRELGGEHVYVLRWRMPGVLVPASETDDRARLRLDALPAGWGMPVLRSRLSVDLPGRPEAVTCRVGDRACRPRIGGAGVVVTTGRLDAGTPVRLDAVLGSRSPEVERLPWPLRVTPVLGDRWWPPLLVLVLAALAAWAGVRLASRPRVRRARLVVLGAVLATGLALVLAPWSLLALVPGGLALGSLPLLLPAPSTAGEGPGRQAPAAT